MATSQNAAEKPERARANAMLTYAREDAALADGLADQPADPTDLRRLVDLLLESEPQVGLAAG